MLTIILYLISLSTQAAYITTNSIVYAVVSALFMYMGTAALIYKKRK